MAHWNIIMILRECEFCREHTPEYLEEFFYPNYVCLACDGTQQLNSKDCFCHAYEPSECGCDADWSDYYEDES